MTSSSSAASATVRPKVPTWSSELANATSPYRLTVPYVGFKPTTPQNAAGCRTLPPVSLPSAAGTSPAATAAADPPELPPGTRSGSTGFRVGPNAEFSVLEPMANSSRFVLPAINAPAARSSRTAVASYGARHPSRIREPHVVGWSSVVRLSFTATGTPARRPASEPASRARSSAASTASARAASSSGSWERNALSPAPTPRPPPAFTPPSTSAIRAESSAATSTAGRPASSPSRSAPIPFTPRLRAPPRPRLPCAMPAAAR